MTFIKDGNKIIIAISGKQLSGKDLVTKLLLEILPDFKRVGLGDAIKMEFACLNNISLQEVEQNKHLYRTELIALGNKGRTLESGLFWINKVLAVPGNLIVPDMRVEKEFHTFKANGAIMVRVEADKEIRAARGILVNEDDPTECALDNIKDWDTVIYNNSDIQNLKPQLNQILQLLPQSLYSKTTQKNNLQVTEK